MSTKDPNDTNRIDGEKSTDPTPSSSIRKSGGGAPSSSSSGTNSPWLRMSKRVPDMTAPPSNPLVTALLTDVYQITMTYAHWKNGRHNDQAVFELFFRKNPFGGEYTVFAGLDEVVRHLNHFGFTNSDIQYLKSLDLLAHCEAEFFDWLLHDVDASAVRVYAMKDGTICFPRVPLLVVEAPLAIGQLLETTLLTLINFPSLLATNAARMVRAAQGKNISGYSTRDHHHHRENIMGTNSENSNQVVENNGDSTSELNRPRKLPVQCTKVPTCIEFGLRRAQGPDGGFSASKYSMIGGFVGTSNVQVGKYCGLNVVGTHAHAFVQAYSALHEVETLQLANKHKGTGDKPIEEPLLPKVLEYRTRLSQQVDSMYATTNDGELAAFTAYAVAFPNRCLCLIDTYDSLDSGLLNFICVACALHAFGYTPLGIRLDSGDLAYLSMECALRFQALAETKLKDDDSDLSFFHNVSITVSNDINEAVLHAINKEEHAITTYGIGTNLVTCQSQPALGCVYKLVEIDARPRMKLSQEIEKVLIPGKKKPYRLYGHDERPILDVMISQCEPPPQVGVRILCRHPFTARKRVAVTPHRVEPLHTLVFDKGTVVPNANRTLQEARVAVQEELSLIRPDILRYINPTPYKVSLSPKLFDFLHELWQSEIPIPELS